MNIFKNKKVQLGILSGCIAIGICSIPAYILIDNFVKSKNQQIMKDCKEQKLMSELKCISQRI